MHDLHSPDRPLMRSIPPQTRGKIMGFVTANTAHGGMTATQSVQ